MSAVLAEGEWALCMLQLQIEQFKISVACGVMDEALAKRLRSGEFKDTKRGAADLPPAFAGKPQMPAASSSTGASAASKPAAAKAQPVLAKASAKRSGAAPADAEQDSKSFLVTVDDCVGHKLVCMVEYQPTINPSVSAN